MQILAQARESRLSDRCKKSLLLALLVTQTVLSVAYLYPLLIHLDGVTGASVSFIALGSMLCLTFLVSLILLKVRNPGKLEPKASKPYTVSGITNSD